jgi:DNA repair photolyase
MNAVLTNKNATNYRGRSEERMNQWFLNEGYTKDQVESIQLEIRKGGFRDLHQNIEKTAGMLIEALSQEILAPVEQEETEADDDLVDFAFNHLRGIFGKHIHEAMLRAGRYLVRTFFGTYENARDWKKIRNQSFRRLEKKLNEGPGNAPKKTWIYDAIKLAVDDHYFRSIQFRTYGQLGHSQKVLLTHVKNVQRKQALATEAFDKGHTVKKLRARIKETKPPGKKGKTSRCNHRDWTEPKNNVSFCTGCENDCIYCYGRYFADRRNQCDPDVWAKMQIRDDDVGKGRKLHDGLVGFPSTHDILPSNLDASLVVLGKLLRAGNQVLIISKPRLDCIKRICSACEFFKDKIIFRFTIGAMDDGILGFWEPGAPQYKERRVCLAYARNRGFQTSVSMEPMLDTENIDTLIRDLKPLVSDKIWLGIMDYMGWIKTRVSAPFEGEVKRIEKGQSPEKLLEIYRKYIDDPVIEWKELARKRFSNIKGLQIPLEGNGVARFETVTGLHVATGYTRVVVGGRGPYVEFQPAQIIEKNLHKPEQRHVYFDEWRSNDDSNVMVYDQKRTVAYADYKVGKFYISPTDLLCDGQPAWEKDA